MNDADSPSPHLPRLLSLAKGYMPSRIFLTALELDVFGRLGSERMNASQMAEQLETDERATEILLNALAGMELLQKNDGLFENKEELAGLLMSGSAHYQGGGLRHNAHLWEAWSHLTEIVRSGRPHRREWTDDMSRDLASAMKQDAAHMAEKMTRVLDCSGMKRMLDLGGGPGTYAIAFARRYPHLHVLVFDRDEHALQAARREIQRWHVEDRVGVEKGDFFVEEFGSGYDLVLLSSTVCILGEKENAVLLDKINMSLNERGRVVIRDSILDDSRTKPLSAAIFAVNMLVATPNGRSYSYSEVKDLLDRSRFKNIHRVPVEGSQLIVGMK